jgi:hypothetical protein
MAQSTVPDLDAFAEELIDGIIRSWTLRDHQESPERELREKLEARGLAFPFLPARREGFVIRQMVTGDSPIGFFDSGLGEIRFTSLEFARKCRDAYRERTPGNHALSELTILRIIE